MKETTYNKYKRERNQLKSIVDIVAQDFFLTQDKSEFEKKKIAFKEFVMNYRKYF